MKESPSYLTVAAWAESYAEPDGGNGIHLKMYDAQSVEYPEPKGLEEDLDIFASLRQWSLSEDYVAVLPGGYLCGGGEYQHPAVLTSDRSLVWDASLGAGKIEDHWIFRDASLPPATYLPETVAPLAIFPAWGDSYFHWMFQVLPRIHLLNESGISIDRYVLNEEALNSSPSSFQHETLAALELDEETIIGVPPHFQLSAHRLVVTPAGFGINQEWAFEFLRSKLLPAAPPRGNSRLYISRRTATRGRWVINENEVKEVLAKFKFKEFLPEEVSVVGQAEAFASASVVIAPHGGALANLVFCKPGTKVVEFFAPTYVHPLYWMLSGRCHLDHYYLIGRGERPGSFAAWPDGGRGLDPIEVDPDLLVELLTKAGL
jgi:hypothetical protein